MPEMVHELLCKMGKSDLVSHEIVTLGHKVVSDLGIKVQICTLLSLVFIRNKLIIENTKSTFDLIKQMLQKVIDRKNKQNDEAEEEANTTFHQMDEEDENEDNDDDYEEDEFNTNDPSDKPTYVETNFDKKDCFEAVKIVAAKLRDKTDFEQFVLSNMGDDLAMFLYSN